MKVLPPPKTVRARPAEPGRGGAALLGLFALAAALNGAAGPIAVGADLPRCPASAPQQKLAPLYQAVEAADVFPDPKTFADAVPLAPAETALSRFKALRPQGRSALAAFLQPLFAEPSTPPSAAASLSSSPSQAHAQAQAQAQSQAPPLLAVRRVGAGNALSRHIQALWPALTRRDPLLADGSSRLQLPRPYVVPGGRFRELYYWDSYFTLLGLKADGREDLVESMIEDFGSLIDRYGHVPNGARSYYLSRSQPPLFYAMAALSSDKRRSTRRRRLGWMRQEHAYWMAGAAGLRPLERRAHLARLAGGELVNRYHDACATPRDESWSNDVALAARSSRPAQKIYTEVRAAAESGWDFSSRWMSDPTDLATLRVTALAPVDLNSLMFGLEARIAAECRSLGDARCARRYGTLARRRRHAINRRFWDRAAGVYRDYDLDLGRRARPLTAATFFPLFVGAADRGRAARLAQTAVGALLAPGGLRTTTRLSQQQWDRPNGWAPLQWIAAEGLRRYGETRAARLIETRFLATVQREYAASGRLVEKYDIERRRPGGGGEYPLQDGFGWTNGVVEAWLARRP